MPRGEANNPGARKRAEYELLSDPGRSNFLIASAARCTPQHAGRIRRQLEERGVIEVIPWKQRQARPRPPHMLSGPRGPQPCRTRDVIARLGPDASPRQVADAAGVSIQAAWTMLRKVRAAASPAALADAAAAADSISVVKTSDPLEQVRDTRELRRRNARRATAGLAMLEARQPARPCKPFMQFSDPFPVGWPRPSEAAARLCGDWCPVSRSCPVSLAAWIPKASPASRTPGLS